MFENEHFRARGMFEQVLVGGKPLQLPALCPRLENGGGSTEFPGAELGQHTREVLSTVLNLSSNQIDDLVHQGVVGETTTKS